LSVASEESMRRMDAYLDLTESKLK